MRHSVPRDCWQTAYVLWTTETKG